MDETYDAWRETRAPDWLVAQGCEEAYWLGAWAAWKHQQARIADLTRQLTEARAILADTLHPQ